MKIGAAQTKPIKGDFQKNIESHLRLIDLALEKHAELIVFPELSTTGYEPTLALKLATTAEDKQFDVFQELCDRFNCVIAVGSPLTNQNRVSIGMIIFQPNQNRITYLKRHLFHTEKEYFISGNSPTNLLYNNTNIGLAICYEISVPEHQQVVSENGAEIYMASVVESFDGIDNAINKMSLTSAKYSMVSIMANCVGLTGKYDCAGKSSVWNKEGKLVGQLNSYEEGIIVYDTNSQKTDINYILP